MTGISFVDVATMVYTLVDDGIKSMACACCRP